MSGRQTATRGIPLPAKRKETTHARARRLAMKSSRRQFCRRSPPESRLHTPLPRAAHGWPVPHRDTYDSFPGRGRRVPLVRRLSTVRASVPPAPDDDDDGDDDGHQTMEAAQPPAGSLSWRLSSHPITLITFLAFRVCRLPAPPGERRARREGGACRCMGDLANEVRLLPASLLVYLFGFIFIANMYGAPRTPCPSHPFPPSAQAG